MLVLQFSDDDDVNIYSLKYMSSIDNTKLHRTTGLEIDTTMDTIKTSTGHCFARHLV